MALIWIITSFALIVGIPTLLWFHYGIIRLNTLVIENCSLLRNFGLVGLALWPIVILEGSALTRRGNPTQTFQHERIHLKQQRELFVIPYYMIYFSEYLFRRLWFTHSKAYRNISFEREAYENENKKQYVNRRNHFAWNNYI